MLIIELERDLRRDLDAEAGLARELEQELAVLRLADLEERPLVGGPDVVALGVDEVDVGVGVADLPADDERARHTVADRAAMRVGTCTLSRPRYSAASKRCPTVRKRLVAVRVSRSVSTRSSTSCVVPRLPADWITIVRSGAGWNTNSLR